MTQIKKYRVVRAMAAAALLAVGSIAWAGAELKDYEAVVYPHQLGQTWAEVGGTIYGAQPDGDGPIGGGAGYMRIQTTGTYVARTLDELVIALNLAQAGQSVFIPGDVEIDCTDRVRAEALKLTLKEGVTLASDRGSSGSLGALIFSDEFRTAPLITVTGDNARVTGIRLRGPDPKLRMEHHGRSFTNPAFGSSYYYLFPTSDGITCAKNSLVVDNCEIYGWSHGGVYLSSGSGHRVHHSHLHHNQRHGLGYGVVINTAFVTIDHNLMDNNRHSIAGTGRPGSGYEAMHNVALERANSHLFDMQGGRDRGDGTNIAGTWMKIHHNTFTCLTQQAIKIRGVPEQEALIYGNWFYRTPPGTNVIGSDGRTPVYNNVYGTPPQVRTENYPWE